MAQSQYRKFLMTPTVFDGEFALVNIPTTVIKENQLTADDFSPFDHVCPIGISPGYSSNGKLAAIAISDDKSCLIVEFSIAPHPRRGRPSENEAKPPRNQECLQLLQDTVLCRSTGDLFAFDMGPLAMSLYCDARLRILNAVDLQSGCSAVMRKPIGIMKAIMGDTVDILEKNVAEIFRYPEYKQNDRNLSATELAMRAWVSQLLPTYSNGAETLAKVKKVNTLELEEPMLNMISKVANDALRLEGIKPAHMVHGFSGVSHYHGDFSAAKANTYHDKFRRGQRLQIVVQSEGDAEYTIRGDVNTVVGKHGHMSLDDNHSILNKTVKSITSIGRDDPTTAEAHRSATVLRILQGYKDLLSESPWIKNIWFPPSDGSLIWPQEWSDTDSLPTSLPLSLPPKPSQVSWPSQKKSKTPSKAHPFKSHSENSPETSSKTSYKPPSQTPSQTPPTKYTPLNASQQQAVNAMCSSLDAHHITIVQGPPGTGKTSVIASFVQFATQRGDNGIWLVAQSNVAVKNIAERLFKVNFFDWKLLVSKDFLFEWHEHIYTVDQSLIIRSDEFRKYPAHKLRDCKVILCTLSMLSNENIKTFTSHIPLRTLVVDEASQIEVGSYIPVFSKFQSTLRKVCFIGDDKQLPPFGQEDLQDLQSIFEIIHLREHAFFLDTQYRMPPQIGQIISEAVYDAKLKSNPLHPIDDKTIACRFINIAGSEKACGNSFMNISECQAVVQLAQKLQDRDNDFQIITPYEGQRGTIEKELKIAGLIWSNKCYNVDSFQGNETDFIIISLVRSWQLGFLDNLRRTNVMLTRCKKGMFIVSSEKFLTGKASKTLVGTFLEKMGAKTWLDMKDVEADNF